ncbi:MAG: hypothetical protein IJ800_06130 [Clostridia bacterium]|nr:hypothetical protein [Clostridia bacterium]
MIDIDNLFEKFLRKYLAENAGKYTEDQLEDKISEIFGDFGKTPLAELEGKSPVDYFSEKKDEELIEELKTCVLTGVSPSDFLCDELERRNSVEDGLIDCVNPENDELSVYCVNILNSIGSVKAVKKYLEILLSGKAGDSLAELITETLCDNADLVKDEIVEKYDQAGEIKKYLVEILANCSPDDDVFGILRDEFLSHKNEIALYASYLTKYGDDRALPLFEEAIKDDGIKYADFKELKLGIEEFGGEYSDTRDFSSDKTFKIIKGN